MNAPQLFRMVAEHGPEARTELQAELDKLDARRGDIVAALAELDKMLAPAQRMTPKAGILEPDAGTGGGA